MKRALLLLAAGLVGCGASDDDPELVAANAWLQRYKAEHRVEAQQYARECVAVLGVPITRDGILKTVSCMKVKAAR